MTATITISIPYRRQCFNPRVQAYLETVERRLNRQMEADAPAIRDAARDLAVYGSGVLRAGS